MKEEIIIAGFGGQGVLSMGKILAYSGLMEGKESPSRNSFLEIAWLSASASCVTLLACCPNVAFLSVRFIFEK
jgi:hypothetical protein